MPIVSWQSPFLSPFFPSIPNSFPYRNQAGIILQYAYNVFAPTQIVFIASFDGLTPTIA
ncbi:hypothetical protein GYMLUDRAFT_41733 [Collybiopsis luxurians FD-317 M1]|uniref:Uncharacterized protein n=1 Tax=Collybiopsis luxurians FD-317 M1 TaxID=944289 RepID=A0A0D0CJC0_9AGAR|nr:hypothetical protein GYMLUDRAFT_41733 [Collybiopsis luxurians FD-317 M1]